MPYKIIDAEGEVRYLSDKMPIEKKDDADRYCEWSERYFGEDHPHWFPFTIVEVE